MSMYNMAFGPTGQKLPIVTICGIPGEEIPRFRDVWVEHDGNSTDSVILAVYTRVGGGNREDYADEIANLESKPTFISFDDDEFDSTYGTFRFRIKAENIAITAAGFDPEDGTNEEYMQVLLHNAVDPIDTSKRWLEAIEAIQNAGPQSGENL